MITKVNYDSTKEKSVINGFLTELNNCIDQYNSILEEVNEASVWIDHEYERAVKEGCECHERSGALSLMAALWTWEKASEDNEENHRKGGRT